MKVDDKILKLIQNVITEHGLDFVDYKITCKGVNRKIRLLIDRAGGVTLDECAEVSKNISEILDTHERSLDINSYQLEISSPGEDYPLTTANDFFRKIGEKVRITYYKGDIIKEVTGKIQNVKANNLTIELREKELTIPLDKIKSGKIKYDI